MKKIAALVLAAMMLLGCTAYADMIEFGTENTLVYDRAIAYEAGATDALGNATDIPGKPVGQAHVTAWQGDWVLVAAYANGEYLADEYDVEGLETGFYAVPENAVTLNIEALYDASANDPSGPLVDVANYFHAHCYDLKGTMTYPEDIDEDGYTLKTTWAEWASVVRGNADGDFNFGPTKINSIKGEDDYLYFNDLTGLEIEEIEDFEEFKYLGMNMDGQLVLCSASKNIVTQPDKADIELALVFAPAAAE